MTGRANRVPLSRSLTIAATLLAVAVAVALVSRVERGPPTPVPGGSPSLPAPDRTGALRGSGGERACTAVRTRATVRRFLRAFSDGDARTLSAVFAPEGEFQWYSVDAPGRPRDRGADDRRALLRYFGRRHRAGERLRLVSLAFNGNNASYGHFEFQVVRSAEDLATTRYDGKGATLCTTQDSPTIVAWAMGREPRSASKR